MEISEMVKLVGHKTGNKEIGLYYSDGLSIEVKLIDAKQVFGRIDVKISPVSGSGDKWVQLDKISEMK